MSDYQVELTDLTGITRESKHCLTDILLCNFEFDQASQWFTDKLWLRFGQVNIVKQNRGEVYHLYAYLDKGIDFEHDSAYAVKLPLIGLSFINTLYHVTELCAWVDPNVDREFPDFHVPRPNYDPRKHPDAEKIKQGGKEYIVVPEKFYLPKFDKTLYDLVRGKKVKIQIKVNNKEGD